MEELLRSELQKTIEENRELQREVAYLQETIAKAEEEQGITKLQADFDIYCQRACDEIDRLKMDLAVAVGTIESLKQTPLYQLKEQARLAEDEARLAKESEKRMSDELTVAQENARHADREVRKLASELESVHAQSKMAHEQHLLRHELAMQSIAELTRQKNALVCKQFYDVKRGRVLVLNADPSDMEFIESGRPWTMEKMGKGVYLLSVTDYRKAIDELQRMGYVTASKNQ
jgi:hypothetical protein